jgi:hypothetical protein
MTKISPFQDERFVSNFKTLCMRFYIMTMVLVYGMIMYRSMVLKQPQSEYEDLLILMTLNVVLFIPSMLYFSGLSFRKIKPSNLVFLYIFMVVLGTLFTIFKYKIYEPMFILGKLGIIASILAILMGIYVLFAWFGYKKTEEEIGPDE